MILEYFGHSLFRLTFASGAVLITDPYGSFYDYPPRALRGDICTVSHHHYDHDAVDSIAGEPLVIDTPGRRFLKDRVSITGILTHHDEVQGQKRGENLVFILEAEGLRVVHLGDLGHKLANAQVEAIGQPDILLLPVGGYYTIDAATAVEVMGQLRPKAVIPMHYQTKATLGMPIEPVQTFLSLLRVAPEPMSLLRVTDRDIDQRPPVLLMTTPEGL